MTNDQLLQPRYKVAATYPHCPFEVGEILIQANPKHAPTLWRGSGPDNTKLVKAPEDYPHLFRSLEWWQERELSDLPDYLLLKGFGQYFRAHWAYPDLQQSKVLASYCMRKTRCRMSLYGFEPATMGQFMWYCNGVKDTAYQGV